MRLSQNQKSLGSSSALDLLGVLLRDTVSFSHAASAYLNCVVPAGKDISCVAASQSSSSSAASQPASKRPLEIAAPSVTIQPAGLSVDTLRYTATTKLQFVVAAGTGPTGAAFYYLTAASRLTGAVPASMSRSNCSSLAPPSSMSAWIDRFTASESPATRPSITFRCWCRPG
jgi:hypothetical protein